MLSSTPQPLSGEASQCMDVASWLSTQLPNRFSQPLLRGDVALVGVSLVLVPEIHKHDITFQVPPSLSYN